MRNDSIGLFWEDIPVAKSNQRGPRIIPPTPDTGWVRPTYFPDLSGARVISIDCETKDPELVDWVDDAGVKHPGKGPGWARGKGHIVGVSVGADGGGRWYFPMRHEVEPELNFDPALVLLWLSEQLGRPHQPKVGANITYDIGWLKHEGVEVVGPVFDVQFAEALLDERAFVNLETLAQKYLGEGKQSNGMYEWLARAYGGPAGPTARKNIYRCSPRLVGPYAESDADLPLRVIEKQWPLLEQQGLMYLFGVECRLIPLMVRMRFAGVRVDVKKGEELYHTLREKQSEVQAQLNSVAGCLVNVNQSETLQRAFDAAGVAYPRTPKGAPSFTKGFLEGLEHPIGELIRDVRKYDKLAGTFVDSYILKSHINGMLYGQFHQLRGDEGGTRSGRFSGSSPNLQNIPSRDEILAPMLRGLFIPDEGHKQWRRYDYSQIEYRFLIHFAVGEGSDEIRRNFNANPDLDYHDMTLDMVAPLAGWDISTPQRRKHQRKPIKNINFGLIYGMGVDKLSRSLGMSAAEGKALFKLYHKAVPFAKKTMEWCADEAISTGVVRTIGGRCSRFDLWGPAGWGEGGIPLPYGLAQAKYGNSIERAYTHKALNRKLQGSAADMMKVAMLQCWEDGIFDYTGVPRLTVHDELDFSDPGGKDDGFAAMQHVMETAVPLRIPVRADMELGPDWGHCE